MTNFTAYCSTKQFYSRLKQLLFFSFILSISFSCRKNKDIYLDGDLPGGNLDVSTTDTVSFRMITERRPAVRTDQLDTLLLGSVSDPVFGRTTATIYSQLLLYTFNKPIINSTTVIDSTVLTLQITPQPENILGNVNDMQTWKVYPLTQDLQQNILYYSDTTITHGSLLGVYTGNFAGKQSVKIRLNDDMAKMIFSDSGRSLGENASFATLVKGLALVADSNQAVGHGAIIPIQLNSDNSNITVYYRTDSARSYKVVFSSNAVRVNHYTHDYRNTPIQKQLDAPGAPHSVAYTQNLAGVRIRLEVPYLVNLARNGPYVVNQARFILPIRDTTYVFSGRQAPELIFAGRGANGFSLPASSSPAAGFVYLYQKDYKYYSLIVNGDFQNLLKRYSADANYMSYGFNLDAPLFPIALWQNIMAAPSSSGTVQPKLILTLTKPQ